MSKCIRLYQFGSDWVEEIQSITCLFQFQRYQITLDFWFSLFHILGRRKNKRRRKNKKHNNTSSAINGVSPPSTSTETQVTLPVIFKTLPGNPLPEEYFRRLCKPDSTDKVIYRQFIKHYGIFIAFDDLVSDQIEVIWWTLTKGMTFDKIIWKIQQQQKSVVERGLALMAFKYMYCLQVSYYRETSWNVFPGNTNNLCISDVTDPVIDLYMYWILSDLIGQDILSFSDKILKLNHFINCKGWFIPFLYIIFIKILLISKVSLCLKLFLIFLMSHSSILLLLSIKRYTHDEWRSLNSRCLNFQSPWPYFPYDSSCVQFYLPVCQFHFFYLILDCDLAKDPYVYFWFWLAMQYPFSLKINF